MAAGELIEKAKWAMGRGCVVIVVALLIVSLVSSLRGITQRECVEGGRGPCGNALIDELDELQSSVDRAAAERAMTLIAVATVLGDPGTGLESQIDDRLADSLTMLDDTSASCVIEQARLFATTNLDVRISRDLLAVLDGVAQLESPVASVVSLGLPTSGAEIAFAVGTAGNLLLWLQMTPALCLGLSLE